MTRPAPGPALWPDCGTLTAYNRHSQTGQTHCARCRAAASARWSGYAKQRYLDGGPRRIPAVGTHRRLRALHAIGWTATDIGARLNPPVGASSVQMTLMRPMIYRERAAAIAKVYDQLWDTPGPSALRRDRALAKGWLPPMAWDDDQLDNPDYVPLEQVLRDWDAALVEERRRRKNLRQYRYENRHRAVDTEVTAA